MGRLIYFEDHHPGLEKDNLGNCLEKSHLGRRRLRGESLIPLQLALDEYDIETCFAHLARYGHCAVFPRANPSDSGKILFLVRIREAIDLNQYLLEQEDQDDQALCRRIDHIQMLENCEESLLARAWDRIGLDTSVRFASLHQVPLPSSR